MIPRVTTFFCSIVLCTTWESFSPSTHVCVVFTIMTHEMMRSIVDIMISFQYFAHLFILMCNLPTTGIWLDGLRCHCIIIFLSAVPTSCTPQVIQSLVIVCLLDPINAAFNLRPPRIPNNYAIPRFLCWFVHFKADVTNNLITGVAFIKGSDNSCAGEISLVAGILPLISNMLQCIHILLLDARCLPLGKDLGPFSFKFDVRSSLVKCAIRVSLLKYSSELAT